jgi:apolipoprotein D and lipocalin family protein
MRFFGLFTAPYYILYVDENYETTVVGHPKKELAWIMSRSPQVESDTYNRLLDELKNRDYKLERFRRMQQEW